VWFEELHQAERMHAIGEIISAKDPDIITLQEVTVPIERLFQQAPW
jgi:endonuclease/exonuclease/phosphatase family metal-dependent hydrolase